MPPGWQFSWAKMTFSIMDYTVILSITTFSIMVLV
jgi:hypothetical protein